jgi:shikimate kinase
MHLQGGHYYDYLPTVALKKPVALVGFFASANESVGQTVAMRSGLNLVEVDRWVEHAAGRSIATLYADQGESNLRGLEARMVKKALAEGPPGIVVLGEGAMVDDFSRKAILEQSVLIHLRYSWAGLLEARMHDEAGFAHPSTAALFRRYEAQDVKRLFEERERDYELADHVISMDNKGTVQAAAEALAWIKQTASL